MAAAASPWKPVEDTSAWKPVQEENNRGILKQYWDRINPVTMSQGIAEGVRHPIDAAVSYGAQTKELGDKAIESFKKGEYAEGIRHGLSYFLNAIPGVGKLLDEAGNKAGSGDYKGAIADTAALATMIAGNKVAPRVLEAATEPGAVSGVASAVAKVPGKVIEAAKQPGTLKIAGGAVEMAGAPVALVHGHPIVATYLGIKGLEAVRKGLAERGAAATANLDEISNSLYGKPFANLKDAQQAGAKVVAENLKNGITTSQLPSEPYEMNPPGPVLTTPSSPAGPGIADLLEQELRARTLEAPIQKASGIPDAPESASLRTPVRPPLASEKVLQMPESAIPEAYRSTEDTGLQIPQEAMARDAVKNKILTHLREAGITNEHLDQLDTNPAARDMFWDHIGHLEGIYKDPHAVSHKTIAAVRGELERPNQPAVEVKTAAPEVIPDVLRNNPSARRLAEALRDELLKSEPSSAPKLMEEVGKPRSRRKRE